MNFTIASRHYDCAIMVLVNTAENLASAVNPPFGRTGLLSFCFFMGTSFGTSFGAVLGSPAFI
jgi:hypothetical protein